MTNSAYYEGSNTYALASFITELQRFDHMSKAQVAMELNEIVNGAATPAEFVEVFGYDESEFTDFYDMDFDRALHIWNRHHTDETPPDADDLVMWGYGIALLRDLWVD